ncbi:MAG: hypothetical protein ABJF11_11685 [Reichenbachiella sp.]|uniref:hypothetical protein n=1 Tax=Reichenbachiella sp. TaxID=2184521 RepID=UPI0032659CDC
MGSILIATGKGKKKATELIIEAEEIVQVRVYDRGKHGLGFNGLYALLRAILKAKNHTWPENKLSAQVILKMKALNNDTPGCHPISLSATDVKNLLFSSTVWSKVQKEKIKKYQAEKLKEFKKANRDLKDEAPFNKIFNKHLNVDGKLVGWLNNEENEVVGQCTGQSRKFPCNDIIAPAVNAPYMVLIPNMILKAYKDGAVVANTRTIMDEEYAAYYEIGDNGWLAMGFDCGFTSGRMNEVRLTEDFTGEWIDVWVYPNDLPFDHSVALPPDAALYPVYEVKTSGGNLKLEKVADGLGTDRRYTCVDNSASGGFNQLKPKRINYSDIIFTGTASPRSNSLTADLVAAHDLQDGDFVCSDRIPPKWMYVGAVVGSGSTPVLRSRPGPHLGFIEKGKYHHLLIVDAITVAAGNAGPEVNQIGVTMLNRVKLKKGYYMILIDDSASISGKKTKYIEEVKKQVDKWMNDEEVEEKYIGFRLIRWNDDTPPDELMEKGPGTTKQIKISEYRNMAQKKPRHDFTVRIHIKNINDGFSDTKKKIDAKFLTTDGKWLIPEQWKDDTKTEKIKISKAKRDKFIKDMLTKELRMVNTKKSSLYTPFVECLDDLIDQDIIRDLTKEPGYDRYPVKIAILSDGQPDPLYQVSTKTDAKNINKPYDSTKWLFRKTASYILATNLEVIGPSGKAPEDREIDDIIAEKPKDFLMDSPGIKQYTVEGKLKLLSEISINSAINLITKTKTIGSGATKEVFWVNRIYKSPRMVEYVNLVELDATDSITNQNTVIHHGLVPHTDCDRGLNTTIRIGPCCEPGF